jgi:ParB family chromosome partitioning protein
MTDKKVPPEKRTSLGARLESRTANLGSRLEQHQGRTASTPPVTMPGQLGAFRIEAQRWQERIAELEEQLRQAKQQGGALEISLDDLHEVAGRRRVLSADEYSDLRNNLAHNPLASPITVRVRAEGGYEIVSGHNRVQIYRDLGRATIKAWLAETSDDEAEDLAFFANALAAKLPDYDKYRGYKRIMEKHPHLDEKDLCERVGTSLRQLKRLMSFANLPEGAHELLNERPSLLGASAAEALADLSTKGRGGEVVDAVQKLFNGELSEERDALRYAETTGIHKPAKPAPAEQTFKLGKAKFATLRQLKTMVRVDCATEEEAALLNQAIAQLIEERIQSLKVEK